MTEPEPKSPKSTPLARPDKEAGEPAETDAEVAAGPESPTTAAAPASWTRARRMAASPLVWDLFLAVITAVWPLLFTKLFYPGRVNIDIANQYLQAAGEHAPSDWHPPVMSAVWHVLMVITGEPGSLLVLQVGMLAVASWLIGVLIHRNGAPRWVSLLGPAIMITPWVVSQMTTLWKDTQMAVSLLLAAVLLVITRIVPKAWILWLPAIALLVYAVGVRKNAVFAVVPIAVYGGWCLVHLWRNRRGRAADSASSAGSASPESSETTAASAKRGRPILLTAASSLIVLLIIAAGVKVTDAAIASQVEVEKTGQISQILLDDVMFSVPDAELKKSGAPKELTDHISSARDKCLEMGEIWDAYWNCYGKGESGRAFSPVAYQDELKQLWLDEVVSYPLRYVEYRTAVFSYYFFTSGLEYWPAEWKGEAEKAGFEPGDPKGDYIFKPYVEDFALGTFPMLFKPWFWALVAVVLLGLGYRSHRRGSGGSGSVRTRSFWPEITALAASALCYIFGYFPIVPANHFRYTFWPALALTAAVVLAIAMWRRRPDTTKNGSAHGRSDPDRDAATPPGSASSKSES
ncbi:hypothetical protein [Brevibacterium epidermidis]|uniref:hypothetical protein n=1 Tax=Brevibacterium epidermidis TaxID=1698 RepID=UPI000BF43961|nr:hypothetical protein [Brevibacterium epidermidis]